MGTNTQFPADLVKFTEEILNGKLHFLCSALSVLLRDAFVIILHKSKLIGK